MALLTHGFTLKTTQLYNPGNGEFLVLSVDRYDFFTIEFGKHAWAGHVSVSAPYRVFHEDLFALEYTGKMVAIPYTPTLRTGLFILCHGGLYALFSVFGYACIRKAWTRSSRKRLYSSGSSVKCMLILMALSLLLTGACVLQLSHFCVGNVEKVWHYEDYADSLAVLYDLFQAGCFALLPPLWGPAPMRWRGVKGRGAPWGVFEGRNPSSTPISLRDIFSR